MRRYKCLLNKHKDILIYLIFGALTTLVNYAVYLPLYNYFKVSATFSNLLAWVVSVLFAFATNKPLVFHSHCWSPKVVVPEFLKFVGCRVVSGISETAILYCLVDVLEMNGNIWKIIASIFVVILNYIGSKYIAFHNNEKKQP